MISPTDEAEKFIHLAGGPEKVELEIQKARSTSDFQWALQLVDRLISLGHNVKKSNKIKAEILREHAVNQINCPTRHYYIQCAKELENSN